MTDKLKFFIFSLLFGLVACEWSSQATIPPLANSQPVTPVPQISPSVQPTQTPLPPIETQVDDEKTAWTLLVYMDADNNLERYGMEDLREMAAGLIGVDDQTLRLVVQIDRAEGYDDSDGDWTEARRFVSADGLLKQEQALGELNMGSQESLSDFLTWGLGNYPAQQYGLVMWGHGVGWQGIVYDQSADSARLSPVGLREALQSGLDSAEIPHFDLIGFDACLMSQLEVYSELTDVAQVAVGSEELIPGSGWNYEDVLGQFVSNPAAPTATLAGGIVDTYVSRYQASDNLDITLSAVDLQQLAGVTDAVQQLTSSLSAQLDAELNTISDARGGGKTFARYFYQEQDRYAAVDLGRFASLVEQLALTDGVVAAAVNLRQQLAAAVLHTAAGEDVGFASGLSIYFPRFGRFYDPIYAQQTPLPSWDSFLTQYHQVSVPAPTIGLVEPVSNSDPYSQLNPLFVRYELEGRLVETVDFYAGSMQDDGQLLLYEYDTLNPEPTALPDGTQLNKWRDGVHADFYIWDGEVTYLRDATTGDYVVMWPIDVARGWFSVQGTYYANDSQFPLPANIIFDHTSGEMVAIWGGDLASPAEITPDEGDQFVMKRWLRAADGALSSSDGETFDVMSLAYDWRSVPDGAIEVGFSAESINNQSSSASASITLSSADADPAFRAYLDPYRGFQFEYPIGWRDPIYADFGDDLLYTSDDSGAASFQLKQFVEGELSAESLQQTVLADWDNVQIMQQSDEFVGESVANRSVYAYVTDEEQRLGVLLTFVRDGVGYVADFDLPSSQENELFVAVERFVTSWQFRSLE